MRYTAGNLIDHEFRLLHAYVENGIATGKPCSQRLVLRPRGHHGASDMNGINQVDVTKSCDYH